MKRSVACDGGGIPLHLVAARANEHDSPLLEPTLAGIPDMIEPRCLLPEGPTMHLDRGYDSGKTRDLLEILGYQAEIAVKGTPAPIQAGKRWPVERTHSCRLRRLPQGAAPHRRLIPGQPGAAPLSTQTGELLETVYQLGFNPKNPFLVYPGQENAA